MLLLFVELAELDITSCGVGVDFISDELAVVFDELFDLVVGHAQTMTLNLESVNFILIYFQKGQC
mgnify:FL=1